MYSSGFGDVLLSVKHCCDCSALRRNVPNGLWTACNHLEEGKKNIFPPLADGGDGVCVLRKRMPYIFFLYRQIAGRQLKNGLEERSVKLYILILEEKKSGNGSDEGILQELSHCLLSKIGNVCRVCPDGTLDY